jgi:hypothetical protein
MTRIKIENVCGKTIIDDLINVSFFFKLGVLKLIIN